MSRGNHALGLVPQELDGDGLVALALEVKDVAFLPHRAGRPLDDAGGKGLVLDLELAGADAAVGVPCLQRLDEDGAVPRRAQEELVRLAVQGELVRVGVVDDAERELSVVPFKLKGVGVPVPVGNERSKGDVAHGQGLSVQVLGVQELDVERGVRAVQLEQRCLRVPDRVAGRRRCGGGVRGARDVQAAHGGRDGKRVCQLDVGGGKYLDQDRAQPGAGLGGGQR